MMKLAIENVTRASMTTVTAEMTPTGLLLALDRAAREAEEDAATDAADILTQAEEANALDLVGRAGWPDLRKGEQNSWPKK